jgi:transposase InsO family protein
MSDCFAVSLTNSSSGEGHLRAAVRAFVQHYHEERPHHGLGNALIGQIWSIGNLDTAVDRL